MASAHTQPDPATVYRLTRLSRTAAEIANLLGCSVRSVDRARKRLGLSTPRTGLPPLEDRLAHAQRIKDDGGALFHAQQQARVSAATLRKYFPDWEPWDKTTVGQHAHAVRDIVMMKPQLDQKENR